MPNTAIALPKATAYCCPCCQTTHCRRIVCLNASSRQVEELAKNAHATDLTEPLELLSDTKRLVNVVKDMIRGAAQQ